MRAGADGRVTPSFSYRFGGGSTFALATVVVGLWAMGVGPRQLGPLGTALYGTTLLGLGLAHRVPQRG